MCVCTGIMQWRFKRTLTYKTSTVEVTQYHHIDANKVKVLVIFVALLQSIYLSLGTACKVSISSSCGSELLHENSVTYLNISKNHIYENLLLNATSYILGI